MASAAPLVGDRRRIPLEVPHRFTFGYPLRFSGSTTHRGATR
jgi:hypothetical protein